MTYLLDSNVFMTPERTYYVPDLAPSFWSWLKAEYREGKFRSIVNVKDEIDRGNEQDYLREWIADLPEEFWFDLFAGSQDEIKRLSEWAMAEDRSYTQAARTEFLSIADSFLVAAADSLDATVVLDGTVVTFEQPAPKSKTSVKIRTPVSP
ncbi:DUF4411 family protein [Corynebacterium frankenforstense]|uniref:DUF4411 family protein n=1 Tax=Corynebacterium frankenforstense TaxID=1230998 RepID=UPI0026ED8FED|nr:DUF4411 family protein [Corynebacterium frankenforstense]